MLREGGAVGGEGPSGSRRSGTFGLSSARVLVGFRGSKEAHSAHEETVGGRKTEAQSEKSLASDHTVTLGSFASGIRPSPGAQPGPPRVLCGDLHVAQVLVHDPEDVFQDGRPQVHMQGEQGAGVGQKGLLGF